MSNFGQHSHLLCHITSLNSGVLHEPDMIWHVEMTHEWNNRRVTLANQMWADYQARRVLNT
jgi:hypothetical protein